MSVNTPLKKFSISKCIIAMLKYHVAEIRHVRQVNILKIYINLKYKFMCR